MGNAIVDEATGKITGMGREELVRTLKGGFEVKTSIDGEYTYYEVVFNSDVYCESIAWFVNGVIDESYTGKEFKSLSVNDVYPVIKQASPVYREDTGTFTNENLYDWQDPYREDGYLDSSGNIVPHTVAGVTRYIPVKSSTAYSFKGFYGAITTYVEYDADMGQLVVNSNAEDTGTFTTLANTKYVRFTVRGSNTFTLVESINIPDDVPYSLNVSKPTKKMLLLGDSITFGTNGITWVDTYRKLNTNKVIYNYAVSGQKLAWRDATVETTTVPVNANDDNVGWNSLLKAIADGVNPDEVVIFLGTNDVSQASPIGSYNDSFAQDIATTSQMTMANALRKLIHKLKTEFSSCTVTFITPLPSNVGFRNYTTLKEVRDVGTQVANRCGATVIDMLNVSRINADEFPSEIYSDGVHPHTIGARKVGKILDNEISKYET